MQSQSLCLGMGTLILSLDWGAADFGQPTSSAGEPLWNLVQNFSADSTVGV